MSTRIAYSAAERASLMTPDKAREVLGSDHFAFAVNQGRDWCSVMARAAWDANTPEKYAAYHAARYEATRQLAIVTPPPYNQDDDYNSGDDMMGASG